MKITRKHKYILGITATLATIAAFFTNATLSNETIQSINSSIAAAAQIQQHIDKDNLSPAVVTYLTSVKTSLDNLIAIKALAADCQQLLNLEKTLKTGFYNVYPSQDIHKLTHVHCDVQNNVATTEALFNYDSTPDTTTELTSLSSPDNTLLIPAADFVHNTGKDNGTSRTFDTNDKGFVISNTQFASYLGARSNIAEFVFSIKTLTEKAGSANIPLNVYIYDVTTSEYLFWVRITADQMISNEKVDKVTVQVPIDTTSRADHKINAAVVTNGGVSGSIDTVRVYPNSKNLIAPIILRNTEIDNAPQTFRCTTPDTMGYCYFEMYGHVAGVKINKIYGGAYCYTDLFGFSALDNLNTKLDDGYFPSRLVINKNRCDADIQIITAHPNTKTIFSTDTNVGNAFREYDTFVSLSDLGVPSTAKAVDLSASCTGGQMFIASDTYEYAPGLSITPRQYQCGTSKMCNWPYPSYGWMICSSKTNQSGFNIPTTDQKTTVPLNISADMLHKIKVRIRTMGNSGHMSIKVDGWRE